MDNETAIRIHELKKLARPKRIISLNNNNPVEKELQELKYVVGELIEIIETHVLKD